MSKKTDTIDPFAAYKMPLGLSGTVSIPLVGTPAVFEVRLPGTMNEDFSMSLMVRLNAEPDDDGNVSIEPMVFANARRDLFFETCIVSASGIPGTINDFFEQYPLAKRMLWERASELAAKADKEAQLSLGKLTSLWNGSSSGRGRKNSTTPSSNQESKSEQSGLI